MHCEFRETCEPFIDHTVGTCPLCRKPVYASQKALQLPVRKNIWWTVERLMHDDCVGLTVCVTPLHVWGHPSTRRDLCGASRRIICQLSWSETCFDAEC